MAAATQQSCVFQRFDHSDTGKDPFDRVSEGSIKVFNDGCLFCDEACAGERFEQRGLKQPGFNPGGGGEELLMPPLAAIGNFLRLR
ncbi:hypothetical protein [Pseudodesulfovibrio portus]|uniref:hypothetical protein n=1 Tax=Pseudodesulfovibrio portus TaxID=231439 RepID=UPI00223188F3|nr:hypothetical protein [Pseudodesulfovibrio portus]